MANVAICMAMDMMYTVLLMRLGSNSLYRSANRSALQERKKEKWNMKPDCKCYENQTNVNNDITCKACLVQGLKILKTRSH